MENSEQQKKPEMFFARLMTGMAIFVGIICIAWSFLPAIGFISLPMCLGALILVFVSFRYRSKLNMNKRWSIFALVFNIIGGTLGYINYTKHKSIIDFTFSPGSLEKKIIKLAEEDIKKKKQENLLKEITNENTQGDNLDNPSAKDEILTDNSNLHQFGMVSKVDDLRIRAQPSLESDILYKVEFGQHLDYLGEKTKQKTKATIGGTERNDRWYKVRAKTPFLSDGWVYGGAIHSASDPSFLDPNTKRKIKIYSNINIDSIQTLTGISWISNDYEYDGVVSYRNNNADIEKRNGKFYFQGLSKDKNMHGIEGNQAEQILRGSFVAGKMTGSFEQVDHYWETTTVMTLVYNQNECIYYQLETSSEGEESEESERDPEALKMYSIQ